jgi:hypothetical protein
VPIVKGSRENSEYGRGLYKLLWNLASRKVRYHKVTFFFRIFRIFQIFLFVVDLVKKRTGFWIQFYHYLSVHSSSNKIFQQSSVADLSKYCDLESAVLL